MILCKTVVQMVAHPQKYVVQQQVLDEVIVQKERERDAFYPDTKLLHSGEPAPVAFPGEPATGCCIIYST